MSRRAPHERAGSRMTEQPISLPKPHDTLFCRWEVQPHAACPRIVILEAGHLGSRPGARRSSERGGDGRSGIRGGRALLSHSISTVPTYPYGRRPESINHGGT